MFGNTEDFACSFSNNINLTENYEAYFKELLEFYSPQIDKNNATAELKHWWVKLQKSGIISKTGIDALIECNSEMYSNINLLLKILFAVPVSTSTPKRMFSGLKGVKTYLRNTMFEDRLNRLTMITVHRSIVLNPDDLIDELVKQPRKLDFLV
uniref:HAT C-terminal dimerisation domain-containing protein n=1 Tax=Sipha flava TaxID=143950 RepID=A0A2S2PV24_9HEMI